MTTNEGKELTVSWRHARVMLPIGLALMSASAHVHAMPANPAVQMVSQPGGRRIALVHRGDERAHWDETPEGYTVARAAGGTWHYVRNFGPSGPVLDAAKVGEARPISLLAHMRPSATEGTSTSGFDISRLSTGARAVPLLMILLEYDDVPATYTTVTDWSQKIFSTDPAAKTIADFYKKASYGNVSVIPAADTDQTPRDGVIGWLHVNSPHPDPGSKTGGALTTANDDIEADALTLADPFIDYASYDSDGDGVVTSQELAIVIVVAGYELASGTLPAGTPSVWAHSLNTIPKTLDGVIVSGHVAEIGEVHLGPDHQAQIGTMAHEMGHLVFGLPDLYDTDYTSDGIGALSLMSLGAWGQARGDAYLGQTPVPFDAWSLYRLGWAEASGGSVWQTLALAPTGQDTIPTTPPVVGIARVRTNAACSASEYFLAQYRTSDSYDAGLEMLDPWNGTFKSGVAIFHVDESRPDNTDELRPLVGVEKATSTSPLYAAGGTFGPTTTPSSLANGGYASGVDMSILGPGAPATTMRVAIVNACDAMSTAIQSPTPSIGSLSFP